MQDEEVWEAPRRVKSLNIPQVDVEPAPSSPVKRLKAAAAGGKARAAGSPSSSKGAQKDGGPCAVCYVTSKCSSQPMYGQPLVLLLMAWPLCLVATVPGDVDDNWLIAVAAHPACTAAFTANPAQRESPAAQQGPPAAP